MSPEELSIEIAVHLYAVKRLTMEQAKRLSSLDQFAFQNELAKTNIYIRLNINDVLEDMRNLGVKTE